jgi:PAS domain S-box-containing protein
MGFGYTLSGDGMGEKAEQSRGLNTKALGRGALIAIGAILLCEPFFPNSTLREPGLIYLLVDILVAYRYGTWAGLLCATMLTGYICVGSQIPTSAFEHTPNNEVRALGSAIIFGFTSLAVGVVRGRILREASHASEARRQAESEAERRRRTEAELRESEELRRLVVASSMDAIVATDAEGKVILWNGIAEAVFGWSEGEARERPLSETLAVDASRMAQAGIRNEARACTKDGRRLDVELYVVPHRSEHGRIQIAFIRDISERKAAEEAIRTLNAGLEQRVRERTKELQAKHDELEGFCYAISHDMRAPLRAIVANARLVLEDEGERVSDVGRAKLDRLAGAALRMSMLVDDLLQHARLGNQNLRISSVDLSALAETTGHDLRPEYPLAEFTVQPGLVAMADPMLLSLALNNLFDNACKYSRPGETPRVSFGTEMRDGETVYFVKDEGVGVDMRYVHNLFRPFERLHHESDYPGTGIGLANVRRVIERHGGRVWIESAPGEGTTVLFTLGLV